jgi:hypothetical protein
MSVRTIKARTALRAINETTDNTSLVFQEKGMIDMILKS